MPKFARSKTVGFVLAECSEFATWDAAIDGPRWRKTLNSEVLAVGACGDLVVCLEANGVLSFWNAVTSANASHLTVPGGRALACSSTACAIAKPSEVEVIDSASRRTLPFAGVTALAFSRNAEKLGLGFADGQFACVDLASGQSAISKVGSAAILSVVERAAGAEWLAACGSSVFAITPDAQVSHVTGKDGSAITNLCANEAGTLIGMQAGMLAVALAWPEKATAGHLSYMDRQITGLSLAEAALWVGLDQCDGNKLDLRTGDLYRTDPHPGFARNRWMVSMGHEADVAASHL
jgi:hypothetical protein